MTPIDTVGSIAPDAMDLERIKERIKELASRPKHVRFEEIETLLDNHIGPMFSSYNHHGSPHHAFTVGSSTFTIAEPRKSHLKPVYVKHFLDAMEEVGLYDSEEEL